MSNKGLKTILVVDDEPRTRQGIRLTLENWSAGRYVVETADNGVEALNRLKEGSVQLLITDVRMPEVSGLDLIRSLGSSPNRPSVVIISGYAEFDYVQQALRLGAVNYLLKPLDKKELLEVTEEALKVQQERQRRRTLERLVDPVLAELEAEGQKAAAGGPVKEALAYMERHLGESLTMSEMAQRLHLNASYFSVLFKEQAGLPFSEYLQRLRLQRSKELLLRTRLSVGEIAEEVGYQTGKYFIKVFKDREGISPSRYRQQIGDNDGQLPG